jgi:hypothetical protein
MSQQRSPEFPLAQCRADPRRRAQRKSSERRDSTSARSLPEDLSVSRPKCGDFARGSHQLRSLHSAPGSSGLWPHVVCEGLLCQAASDTPSRPMFHSVFGGDVRKFAMSVCALLLTIFVSAEASAQRRVTGRVLGNNNEPIVSASVNVQGTTIGGYTGDDGRFSLNNVPAGAQVLVVRRIGFRRVNMPLTATSDAIDIRLEPPRRSPRRMPRTPSRR